MIIWIASYPKSGNTWLRSFLVSLLYNKDPSSNLKNLNLIEQYPNRRVFNEYSDNLLDLHEVKKFWITTQDKLNKDKKVKFLKTHNSLCNLDNYYFTNARNSLGVIYIVRDPRNVITSIKNHYSYEDYKQAEEFIFDENATLGVDYEKLKNKNFMDFDIITPISSWKNHYNSWKMFRKNYLLIKYEDLIKNPLLEFKKICDYLENLLKIELSNEQINLAIKNSSFGSLKNTEEKYGFDESTYNKKKGTRNKFFFLGPENNWMKLLNKKTIYQIEKNFKSEMKELRYI